MLLRYIIHKFHPFFCCAFSETELSTPDTPGDRIEDFSKDDPIRTYERRALNYLVNEYMLMTDYKVTSVTFAEENPNQVMNKCRSVVHVIRRLIL